MLIGILFDILHIKMVMFEKYFFNEFDSISNNDVFKG